MSLLMMNLTPLMMSSLEPASPLIVQPGEVSITERAPPGCWYCSR